MPAERPSWLPGALGDTQRRNGARLPIQNPLWRDLRRKTTHRIFGALTLDELCQETDINTEELRRRLREQLRRSLSRQSLAAWRSGDRAAPTEVLMAAAAIVHRTLAEASLVVAMRVLNDPDADPHFAGLLRFYLSHGRTGDAV
jgi:hypothetical protein